MDGEISELKEDVSELETIKPSLNQNEIIKVLEIVERDSMAIAESYTSLFSSLRLALSRVTNSSVDHMQCFNDVAGRVQESGKAAVELEYE
ncbi:hypothetical protein IFM89_037696 [Coptis chinensis]|uniref:BLOC-1-related complex subunit 6 C-terminal helix domain-containing protein n=1 Tax=Coptis chinensis TaxID=261450 RepID=A0A835M2V6_9MAGN|nr:hypothetical protein IFM89_037696 [Coptis chinensis]